MLTDPLADMLRTLGIDRQHILRLLRGAGRPSRIGADWPHKKMAGEMKAFFGRMAAAMRVWVETCRQIGY